MGRKEFLCFIMALLLTVFGGFKVKAYIDSESALADKPHLLSSTTVWVPDNYTTIQRAINSANIGDSIIVRHGTYYECARASPIPVLNINTGIRYSTIQEAINSSATREGHTIFVSSGTYNENVVVNKSLNIFGERVDNTIINGSVFDHEPVLNIIANNVHIEGFTIDAMRAPHGINLRNISNVTINGNRILYLGGGVILENSAENEITNNFLQGDGLALNGIILSGESSRRNIISSNSISCRFGSNVGVRFTYGANHNLIIRNNITDNDYGIYIASYDSNFNTIVGNTISRNYEGMRTGSARNNTVYHNNFIDNTHQLTGALSRVRWDNGFEGNYWSDYDGEDADSDGIGDTPYTVDGDNYPLMGMFSDFAIASEHHVQIVSNSTLSDFHFNGTAISFNVTGENWTTGFCRTSIPTDLLNETLRVFVNGTEVSHIPLTDISNNTHAYHYFTYYHSTQEVVIVPEFPSLIILPLFMIITLLAAIFCKRKQFPKLE